MIRMIRNWVDERGLDWDAFKSTAKVIGFVLIGFVLSGLLIWVVNFGWFLVAVLASLVVLIVIAFIASLYDFFAANNRK